MILSGGAVEGGCGWRARRWERRSVRAAHTCLLAPRLPGGKCTVDAFLAPPRTAQAAPPKRACPRTHAQSTPCSPEELLLVDLAVAVPVRLVDHLLQLLVCRAGTSRSRGKNGQARGPKPGADKMSSTEKWHTLAQLFPFSWQVRGCAAQGPFPQSPAASPAARTAHPPVMFSPSSLATRLRFLKEILPVSSSSKRRNACIVRAAGPGTGGANNELQTRTQQSTNCLKSAGECGYSSLPVAPLAHAPPHSSHLNSTDTPHLHDLLPAVALAHLGSHHLRGGQAPARLARKQLAGA